MNVGKEASGKYAMLDEEPVCSGVSVSVMK